jgi:V-type H+-transporting ATPase subunit a
MKLAIVIGVIHMTFGIFLKGLNTVYFGQWTEFFFEFIPQLVFMTLTFGYMVALIFIKWSLPWQETLDTKYAPSIIAIFIKMALQPGTYPEDVPLVTLSHLLGHSSLWWKRLWIHFQLAVRIPHHRYDLRPSHPPPQAFDEVLQRQPRPTPKARS